MLEELEHEHGGDAPVVITPDADILYLGVDLGTSRTAASASNGLRASLESVVGWPRDVVSRSLHDRDVLFGEDALSHRLSLDVVRPISSGRLRHAADGMGPRERSRCREAARALLGRIIDLVRSSPRERMHAAFVTPARTSPGHREALVDLARDAGIDATTVVSGPLAIAYGLGLLDGALVLDIGAGTTNVCRVHGTLPDPEDQVTLDRGGDFIDGCLGELIRARHPDAQFSPTMLRKAKERFCSLNGSGDRAVVVFPVKGRPTPLDITEEVHRAAAEIVPEIVETVRRMVTSFDPEFQERMRSSIVISGGGSRIHGLPEAIEDGLKDLGGGRVSTVEEPLYAGADGALRFAQAVPAELWSRSRR